MTKNFKNRSMCAHQDCTSNDVENGINSISHAPIAIPTALNSTIYSCVNHVLRKPVYSSMSSLVSSETTTQCDETASLTENYLSQKLVAKQTDFYFSSEHLATVNVLNLKTGSKTGLDQMSTQHAKTVAKKNYILKELVSTEKVFVCLLSILQKEYLNKLVSCMDGLYESLKAMRCYTSELQKIHSKILTKMTNLLQTPLEDSANLLEVCAEIAETLSSKSIAVYYYQNYIHNYYLTLAVLQKLSSEGEKCNRELLEKIEASSLSLENQYKKFLLQKSVAKKWAMAFDVIVNFKISAIIKTKQTVNETPLYESFKVLQKEMFASSGENASLKVDLSFKSLIQSPISRISKYKIFLQQLLVLFRDDKNIERTPKTQRSFDKLEKGLCVLSRKLEEINNFDNTAAFLSEAFLKEPLHTFISTHVPSFTVSGKQDRENLPVEALGQCFLSGPCIAIWLTKQSEFCYKCANEDTQKTKVKVKVMKLGLKKGRLMECACFKSPKKAKLTGEASYLFLFRSYLLITKPFTEQQKLKVLFSIPLQTATIITRHELEMLPAGKSEPSNGLQTQYEHCFKIQFKIKNMLSEGIFAFYNNVEHREWEQKLQLLIGDVQRSSVERASTDSKRSTCLNKLPTRYLCTVFPENIFSRSIVMNNMKTKIFLKNWFHPPKIPETNKINKPFYFTILFTKGKNLEIAELSSGDGHLVVRAPTLGSAQH